jgi:putative redox protein
MKHEIETMWMGRMKFNALVNGHTIVMDAPERAGGEDQGPIPKPFVLAALSGCTGMDIVKLLTKSGRQLRDFSLKVSGEISKQHPIVYTSVHIIYEMKGDPADETEALSAVMESQEKLCGVSDMLKRIMPVTWEVSYNGKVIFNNHKEALSSLN